MGASRTYTVTLPADLAEAVERRISVGDYASASDVVRAGVLALLDRDAAVEQWLREEVVAGHAEYLADPSQAVPAEAILDRIKARRQANRAR